MTFVFDWLRSYPHITVYVKCWVDVDGKNGFEVIPSVAIAPDTKFNLINAPLLFLSNEPQQLTAPATYTDKAGKVYNFAFWQSEKTGLIIKNRVLSLNVPYESDSWWQNLA